jgi:hypothetical protein
MMSATFMVKKPELVGNHGKLPEVHVVPFSSCMENYLAKCSWITIDGSAVLNTLCNFWNRPPFIIIQNPMFIFDLPLFYLILF